MKPTVRYRLIAIVAMIVINAAITSCIRAVSEREARLSSEAAVAQERAEAEAVRAFAAQDEDLRFGDDDETQTIKKPGSLVFLVPVTWEDEGEVLGGGVKLSNPERDRFFNAFLYEDMCLTCTSSRDVAKRVFEKLSTVSMDDESPKRGKLGQAEWIRYAVHSDSRDSSSKRSYGYLELIMSGHDVYYVMILQHASGYTREVQKEMHRILNSLSGPEDAPNYLEDSGREPEEGDAQTDSEDEETMRGFLSSLGTYQSYQVEGEGNELIDIPVGALGTGMAFPSLMEVSYEGPGSIVLRSYNEGDDEYHTLAERTGPYHGLITNMRDTYSTFMSTKLDVAAEGAWTITFSPMTSIESLVNGGEYEGDFVACFDEDVVSELHITHPGDGAFCVTAAGVSKTENLADAEGPFDKTVEWDDPHTLFVVTAEGPWSISW